MTKCGSATLLWLAVCALVFSSCGGGGSAPGNPQDSTIPVIAVSGVSHGLSVQDLVGISAQASDPVGIDSLTLYIDNQVISRSAGSELAYDWDTLRLEDGWIPVAFMAKDAAGNRGYAAMAVWIGNGSPTPVGPPPDVEPPIIVDPVPPAPEPDPPPPPPPPPPPDPGPQPILGSGTEEDPFKISLKDDRMPGIPTVMLLGLEIGKRVHGLVRATVICSDDKGVQDLKIYAGQTFICESTTSVAEPRIDTTAFKDGLLNISILLYDGDAHYVCDVLVFVTNHGDNSAPRLKINDFEEFTGTKALLASGEYPIHAEARDESGVSDLFIRVGGETVEHKTGSGDLSADYTLDTLHYPGYDPDDAVDTFWRPIQYRDPDDTYVGVLITAIDPTGNVRENTLSVKLANRIHCTAYIHGASEEVDLGGAHVWMDVLLPGSGESVRIERTLLEDNWHFWGDLPVGNWTIHCELNGVEDSRSLMVTTKGIVGDTGSSNYTKIIAFPLIN